MKNKEIRLAKTACNETMLIYGRNENGKPDQCFTSGNEYYFCYDSKKDELFTVNDVNEVHFLTLNDDFTQQHFTILGFLDVDDSELDDVTKQRFRKLFKDRHDFSLK